VNSGPTNQPKLDETANSIDRLGSSYPDTYTGLEVDIPGDRLIVYRKKDSRFDGALARLHTGVRIALRDAPRSRREMEATRNRLVPLLGHTNGYHIWSLGAGSRLSWTRGVVEVGISGDLALAKRELGATFGDRIEVAVEQPPSAG
jgi:hypothetical protein